MNVFMKISLIDHHLNSAGKSQSKPITKAAGYRDASGHTRRTRLHSDRQPAGTLVYKTTLPATLFLFRDKAGAFGWESMLLFR